jgi:hypothetical protein
MVIIRGNLKTGEWHEVARYADPRDVTINQAAGVIARALMKGKEKTRETQHDRA